MTGPVHTVTMYSRRTCGLCDEARVIIERTHRVAAFTFDEVFIDGDDDLERDYGLRVPVVAIDGHEQFEYTVDPVRLAGLLA